MLSRAFLGIYLLQQIYMYEEIDSSTLDRATKEYTEKSSIRCKESRASSKHS